MTDHTWKRQIESFMLFQSATPAECLVAFRTGKWLLYCVDPFMIFKSQLPVNDFSHLEHANGVFMLFQSTTSAERLVTFPTGKWLLYCVDPFMIFKSQLPVNDFSHLEQANGVFMLFQSTTPAERLVSFPTGKWLLYCGSFHDFQITTICKWPSRTTIQIIFVQL